MTAQIDFDDGIGFLKRRALRRQFAGIKTIGPITARPVPAPPTPAGGTRRHHRETAVEARHRAMIERELALVDGHARALAALVLTVSDAQRQELEAEGRRLALLRSEIEHDLTHPITHDREGRMLGERDFAILRHRAAEIADSEAFAAGRADAEGRHRDAARHRHDSLRARHIAEYEARWRSSLRGYSYPG